MSPPELAVPRSSAIPPGLCPRPAGSVAPEVHLAVADSAFAKLERERLRIAAIVNTQILMAVTAQVSLTSAAAGQAELSGINYRNSALSAPHDVAVPGGPSAGGSGTDAASAHPMPNAPISPQSGL